jgi:adenylate cyclase
MDLRASPLGRIMPGVEAHAQALEQILTGGGLARPAWATAAEAIVLVAGSVLAGVLALQARALLAAGLTALLLMAVAWGGWHAFTAEHLLLNAIAPMLSIGFAFVVCSLLHHFSSERQQRFVKEAFSRYVSPNLVQHLVSHPGQLELGGRRQQCSFIFTDLAGFTSLMEKLDPGEAVSLLNAYLDKMIAIAFSHNGTLDRIVGDAVAIMFSAPVPQQDHQARALACALEMDAFATRYAQDLQAKGIAFGMTRIGVHTGEVIVGNFGGSTIFDYRALGDPVNTAARLESVNKHLGTRICVSAATLAGAPGVMARPVGELVLKGKTQALEVLEPVTESASNVEADERAPLQDYAAAYVLMRNGSADALPALQALAKNYPQDPLVRLHLARLAAGETGVVITMASK